MPVLRRATLKDKMLMALAEDIQRGRLHPGPHNKDFEKVFLELTYTQGVIMRGEQLVIPYKLQSEVIALAHEGHLGMQATIRNLRERVWWPRMAQQAKEYVATCLPCAAAVPRNDPAPMVSREMPAKPWTHCSVDYKGPVGGCYYFHVIIDQYSR